MSYVNVLCRTLDTIPWPAFSLVTASSLYLFLRRSEKLAKYVQCRSPSIKFSSVKMRSANLKTIFNRFNKQQIQQNIAMHYQYLFQLAIRICQCKQEKICLNNCQGKRRL